MRHFFILFILIITSAFGLLYLVKDGWYPMVIVNSRVIWSRTVNKEAQAITHYYQQITKTYNQNNAPEINYREIKKTALENLIEKRVISDYLNKMMNRIELTASIKNTVDNHLNKPNLEQAALALYGLNLADFYQLVLMPQAEKELLERQLQVEGINYADWLSEAKKSAKIILLTKEL